MEGGWVLYLLSYGDDALEIRCRMQGVEVTALSVLGCACRIYAVGNITPTGGWDKGLVCGGPIGWRRDGGRPFALYPESPNEE
jgi:hypothetical protein